MKCPKCKKESSDIHCASTRCVWRVCKICALVFDKHLNFMKWTQLGLEKRVKDTP